MCGIAGYIGNKNISSQLVGALKLLEYRGYDSAGVAVLNENKICVSKACGNILKLQNYLKESGWFNKKNGRTAGIAHTRWATHGEPSVKNAHPHLSGDEQWAVVHNGIIENFDSLKKSLTNKGFNFKSQTDTEVIVHLLQCIDAEKQVSQKTAKNMQTLQNVDNAKQNLNELHSTKQFRQYANDKENINTVINACKKLKGSYALCILNNRDKSTLYLAKNKSPLYIAISSGEVFVASDPICFEGKTNKYFALEDNEFCKAQIDGLIFYNSQGKQIKKEATTFKNFNKLNNKKSYKHFMLKEIKQTPNVLKNIVDVYKNNNIFNNLDRNVLLNAKKIILIGCGTAYHASLMGAAFIEKFCGIEARAFVASEFRYSNPIVNENTVAILVSQSGETADTLMAQEVAQKLGAKTIALTNVMHSSLTKIANFILPVCAGPEIAVASTKAYTAQVCVLYMFAKFLSNLKNNTIYNFFKDILDLSENIKCRQSSALKNLAQSLEKQNSCFFIGKGYDCITAEEASLKLKEITYINSQAYPAGELKHGFLALVTQGTYVFVLATQKKVLEKTLNSASEALARGAKLIVASQFNVTKRKLKNIFCFLPLKKFNEDLMPIVSIISFQLLSYLTSIEKNLNPDQPRNLAKSVTVE